MATKWTAAQTAAIETKNKTLLLSAAAGSGKTSTLTERIIRSITDKDSNSDISNMLIVTFTRASAMDLKSKIFNALSKALAEDPSNKRLTKQLIKLGSAKISTIDSFYLNAVKSNFSALGLSSAFRIADSSETDMLAKSVMSDTIEYFYDTEEDFSSLCECFEKIKDTEGALEKLLLNLYSDCLHTPEGVKYLSYCAKQALEFKDTDILDTAYGEIITSYTKRMLDDYLEYYENAISDISSDENVSKAYSQALEEDRAFCLKLWSIMDKKAADSSYAAAVKLFNELSFKKFGALNSSNATEDSAFCKELRASLKETLTWLNKEFFGYSPKDVSVFFETTAKHLNILYRVLNRFEQLYYEEKRKRNILELTDVKRYALKLFANDDGTPTELAKSYSQQFTDIYIDEYQDVDPVQDLIFRCISTPTNRFMVGDIKQSIYSFRGAEPSLFANYRAAFPQLDSNAANSSDNATVFMSENFRCSKPIIDFTNLVCSNIFTACKDSIGYTKADDLVFAKGIPEKAPPSKKVTVTFFAKPSKADGFEQLPTLTSTAQSEALYIANTISELLKNGYTQEGKKIMPGDIAVLFRNKRSAKYISDALAQLNIPYSSSETAKYFQNPDVLMALCILNAVDNPQRDVYLAGALRSPIFGFSMDDILIINAHGAPSDSLYDKLCIAAEDNSPLGKKCADFNDTLSHYRAMAASLPVDKFLKKLFATEAFVASGMVSDKAPDGQIGNLRRLYEYARTFEAGSFKGLYNFIEFINNTIENGATIETVGQEVSRDKVTLTTIHKSKGLEFPVCFVCNTASDLTPKNDAVLSFKYGYGIAMNLSDKTGFAQYESPLKKLLDLKAELEYTEEEMRILYVALTRAKEMLYVTGSYSRKGRASVKAQAKFDARFNCTTSVMSAGSYMDWILAALSRHGECQFAELNELFPYEPSLTPKSQENSDFNNQQAFDSNLYETLREKFSFVYPYDNVSAIPTKLAVSRLSPDTLDPQDDSIDIFETDRRATIPDIFLPSASSASSVERGTATHLFLQFCDIRFAKKYGVKEALASLLEKRFITREIAELVYLSELEKFIDSDLAAKMLEAKKVIREQRFNILIPADELASKNELKQKIKGEMIAVQGVIDLIIIDKDDKIYLYDYKTDRLTREQLSNDVLGAKRMNELHGMQLSYYAKAVSRLFGKHPEKIAVYSTHAAKIFDISEVPLCLSSDIL